MEDRCNIKVEVIDQAWDTVVSYMLFDKSDSEIEQITASLEATFLFCTVEVTYEE